MWVLVIKLCYPGKAARCPYLLGCLFIPCSHCLTTLPNPAVLTCGDTIWRPHEFRCLDSERSKISHRVMEQGVVLYLLNPEFWFFVVFVCLFVCLRIFRDFIVSSSYVYGCFSCVNPCAYAFLVQSRPEEDVIFLLLELQKVTLWCTGNRTQVLWKSSQCSLPLSHPSTPL